MKAQVRNDVFASAVGVLSLFPACIAVAILSGADSWQGVISAVIGTTVVSMLLSRKVEIVAPAASLAVVSGACIAAIGFAGFAAATLTVGFLQITLGYFRLGRWVRFLSPAVVKGLMAGIGLMIIWQQFSKLTSHAASGTLISFSPQVIVLVSIAFIALVTVKLSLRGTRWAHMPFELIAIALTALGAVMLGGNWHYLSWSIAPVNIHSFSFDFSGGLAFVYFTASLFALSTTKLLITSSALEDQSEQEASDYRRELMACGVGNMLCGLVGGLPISAHMSRSAMTIHAGGATRLSVFLQGLWLGLLFMFCAFTFKHVPLEAFFPVLLYAGFTLLDLRYMKKIMTYRTGEGLIFIGTGAAVILAGINVAFVVGLILSMLMIIKTLAQDLRIEVEHGAPSGEVWLHLGGAVTFMSLPRLTETLERLGDHQTICVDTSQVYFFDEQCLTVLEKYRVRMAETGRRFLFDRDSLVRKSQAPINNRQDIYEELRLYDRRHAAARPNQGRRSIDKVIYGHAEMAELVEADFLTVVRPEDSCAS